MSINWSRFKELISQYKRFVLTSHIRPDCDALGSELGMALILESLGKDVRIINGQDTPSSLEFIDPQHRIQVLGRDITPNELDEMQMLMILDTSAWAQLGPMSEVVRYTHARKMILDHHVSEDDLGAESFRDIGSEATGKLVVQAAEQLGVKLTPQIAMPLFAALATDTGWFRFSSVTSETYQVAGQLVAAGARPDDIYAQLYERDTVGRVRLRGTVLARVETELNGRLVHTHVLKDDFTKTGAVPSDTEDAINMTMSIADTKVAVIFIEQIKGGFKISFRSRCKLDCSEVAGRFGGGGHKAAAGAFVEGTLEEVRPKVLDVVRAAMQ